MMYKTAKSLLNSIIEHWGKHSIVSVYISPFDRVTVSRKDGCGFAVFRIGDFSDTVGRILPMENVEASFAVNELRKHIKNKRA